MARTLSMHDHKYVHDVGSETSDKRPLLARVILKWMLVKGFQYLNFIEQIHDGIL
jgi:hypothetical protein